MQSSLDNFFPPAGKRKLDSSVQNDLEDASSSKSSASSPDSIDSKANNNGEKSSQEAVFTTEDDVTSEIHNENNTNLENQQKEMFSPGSEFNGGFPYEALTIVPETTSMDLKSISHTCLVDIEAARQAVVIPYPKKYVDKWSTGFVRLPCSAHCQLKVPCSDDSNGSNNRFKFSDQRHWDTVKMQLSNELFTADDIISAIESYNPGFSTTFGAGFKHFFTKYLHHEESARFFSLILPKMQQLALKLPQILTQPIPLLAQNTNCSVTMSKIQVASLLANSFFNTFPEQQRERGLPRTQNFQYLFNSMAKKNREVSNFEKIRCLLNYFDRVVNVDEDTISNRGLVSFHRRCLEESQRPQWEKVDKHLTKCHVKSSGFIEDQSGMLHVDFANRFVGGGVLGHGCVQEEIMYITHPELIVSRLFTPELLDSECLVIQGAERYCNHSGYADSFRFVSNHTDASIEDSLCRKLVTAVAMDATAYRSKVQKQEQFQPANFLRELNKAYIGFKSTHQVKEEAMSSDGNQVDLTTVATGNWGCGAFGGNTTLKFIIQWMAASHAGRDVLYLTFNDVELARNLSKITELFKTKSYTVKEVWKLLCVYNRTSPNKTLLQFLLS